MNLLDEIKTRLGITGDFHDNLLLGYARDVKAYLISAGVSKSVVDSVLSVGCIARGVSDVWLTGSFGDLFCKRAIQLSFEEDTELEAIPETPQEEIPEVEEPEGDGGDVLPND